MTNITVLLHAAACGDIRSVKALIEDGINVNCTSYLKDTALIFATSHGSYKVVEILLQNGALVNKANYYGNTALSIAASNGSQNIVKLLLQGCANIYVVNGENLTPKMMAAKYCHHPTHQFLLHTEIIDIVISLSPLELSPYVLLWIIQWTTQFQDRDQLWVLRLIEGIQRSRRKN